MRASSVKKGRAACAAPQIRAHWAATLTVLTVLCCKAFSNLSLLMHLECAAPRDEEQANGVEARVVDRVLSIAGGGGSGGARSYAGRSRVHAAAKQSRVAGRAARGGVRPGAADHCRRAPERD